MSNPDTPKIWKEISKIDWRIAPTLDVPLKTKTSIGVGGSADIFVKISTFDELRDLFRLTQVLDYPWLIIGNGTNLLVRDSGFPGVVIRLKGEFSLIERQDNLSFLVGAGVPNTKLSNFCQKNELTGLEFLFTIPGTLGGAIHMNAGAHGSEIKEWIDWVDVMTQDGKIKRLNREECRFSYRHSIFKTQNQVILRAKLSLQSGVEKEIKERKERYISHRKKIQPTQIKTWGSVFLNPEGMSAGKMIESCGLKGKGVGGAIVNTKHANFIQNMGNATFEDLQNTIKMVQNAVKTKYGIDLIPEGEIIPNKCNKR